MLHRLRVGHFDRDALARGELIVARPLTELEIKQAAERSGAQLCDGEILVGGEAIRRRDGYLEIPWMTPHLNQPAVEFVRQLQSQTNCVVFEHLAAGELSVDELDRIDVAAANKN